MKSKND